MANIRVETGDFLFCEGCDNYRTSGEDTTENTYYWHNHEERASDREESSGYTYVFTESCGTFEITTCDYCDHNLEDAERIGKLYVCGDCDSQYSSPQEASQCCR